jgi:acetate kinase
MSLLVFNAGSSTLEFGLIDARAALRQNGARGHVGWSDPA